MKLILLKMFCLMKNDKLVVKNKLHKRRFHAFALSGREDLATFSQGDALGYMLCGLSGRLLWVI